MEFTFDKLYLWLGFLKNVFSEENPYNLSDSEREKLMVLLEEAEQTHEKSFEEIRNDLENGCCKPLITKYWDNRLKRYEYTTHENGEVKFLTYEDGYKKGFEDAVKQIKGEEGEKNVRD